jgi:hypothetical protein
MPLKLLRESLWDNVELTYIYCFIYNLLPLLPDYPIHIQSSMLGLANVGCCSVQMLFKLLPVVHLTYLWS